MNRLIKESLATSEFSTEEQTGEPILMDIWDACRIVHETNRALRQGLGQEPGPSWEAAPDDMRVASKNGVQYHLTHPDATPEGSHENWMQERIEAGWKYGEVKDEEQKTHPCLVSFEELPIEDQSKDYVYKTLVDELRPYVRIEE